jgi:death-on-curing protein
MVWVDESVVLAIHDEQLAEHGGAAGIRDRGLLSSALARPRNLAAYGSPDLAALAAVYGYGLLRDPPFVDGNKRTALVVVELFLALHGRRLTASDEECVITVLAVAEGVMDEAAVAHWIGGNLARDG